MGFNCGIIGLPNVGKSTIFNALTSKQVAASNYPFCTIEPNIGIVPLADSRLNAIQSIIGSAKATPTSLQFIDIAGLVKGASRGEGLGNQFLNQIQAVDAIAHIVRCFEDANIAHTSATIDPIDDVEVITTELILKDLEIAENRIEKLKKLARMNDKSIKAELELLTRIKEDLEKNSQIKQIALSADEKELIKGLNFLTLKPILFIANVDENSIENNPHYIKLKQYTDRTGEYCIEFCGKAQAEIAQLDEESQKEFLAELHLDELGLIKIVKAGYRILNLISFFTANENETHAWTIPKGTNARKAAGKIHSDFEKGFIKAEVIKYVDLMSAGSETKLREQGKISMEGKEYIVEDGDLIFFHFH